MPELVVRSRALGRRPVDGVPPVVELAGLTLDPFRREVFRDGRYVGLTRNQFAVLEVLMAARGGVVSAESLLEQAWDENAHHIHAVAQQVAAGSLEHRVRLQGPRDELRELADTFDTMLDRLQASFDEQRRFAANASHELRTPYAIERA